jgi:hypothetical protein
MSKFLMLSVLLCAFMAFAADSGKIKPAEDEIATADGNDANASAVKAADLATKYGVTEDSINQLKTLYTIGYGGISHAFALALNSGKTVEEILVMKTGDKLGWGEIAKKLDLKPGEAYTYEPKEPGVQSLNGDPEKRQLQSEKKAEARMERAEKRAARSTGKN